MDHMDTHYMGKRSTMSVINYQCSLSAENFRTRDNGVNLRITANFPDPVESACTPTSFQVESISILMLVI
jgi:hypothetical protein